ncbi:MAG TPA: hypothetical protein VGO56_05920 [Pyrinomonadaceae bacterium]|jgi:hypothetical protein|nr:hypothetical protein [Pyrinomonadaceae bacterium]
MNLLLLFATVLLASPLWALQTSGVQSRLRGVSTVMAATVLNSPKAVAMSVYVVRAFIQMRERLVANREILKRLTEIDKPLLEHDSVLWDIYRKLLPLLNPPPEPPKRRIGFGPDDKV